MRIVRTKRFQKDIKRIGASASDIAAVEGAIVANPIAGAVIPGLGGVRKIRFGIGSKGKRGGGRAIYFLALSQDAVLMLFAYAKNEQKDLTSDQRKAALAIIKGMNNDKEI